MNINQLGIAKDFKEFIIKNNILTVLAAVTCAFSTGIMIRSFVSNIFLPGVWGLFINKTSQYFTEFHPITQQNVSEFIKDFVSWIFVVIFTFILVQYVFSKLLLRVN